MHLWVHLAMLTCQDTKMGSNQSWFRIRNFFLKFTYFKSCWQESVTNSETTKFDVYFDIAKVIFRKRARDKSRFRKVRSNFLEKHLGFVARYKCRKNITLNHKICIIQRVLALCYFWDLEKIRISQKSH